MGYDGSLKFDTSINENGFNKGLKNLGGIASKGMAVLAGAVAGVATAMGTGIALGVKYNASIEQYQTSFEVMTGSADKAAEVIERLKKVGAETPFELPELADTTQLLMNYGFTADDAMDKMMMLGDISQGSADKMSRIATAYGQMSSAGKVSLEDVKQMIEAGFNPLQEISESTGESMESLYKRISKGTLSVDEITASMERATSEGGKYFQSMEKQSQTVNGLISTLKDNAQQLLGEVVKPISESMAKELLPSAINAMEQLTTAFQTEGVDGLIQAGGQIITNLLLGIAEAMPNIIDTAVQVIAVFISNINVNLPQILSAGGRILQSIINGCLQLLPLLVGLAFNIITTLLTGLAQNAPALMQQGIQMISGYVNSILSQLPKVLQTGINIITELLNGLLVSAPQIIQQAFDMLTEWYTTIIDMLPTILQSGVDMILSLLDGLIANAPKIIKQAGTMLVDFVAEIASHLPEILKKGIEIIGELLAGIIEKVPDLIGEVPGIIADLGEAFLDKDWGSIGLNIIKGIASGITGAIGTIVDAAKNAAKNAYDAACDFLGINSPSRLFRDKVGKYMALGMGIGFEKNIPETDMEKQLGKTVNKLKAGANSVFKVSGIKTTEQIVKNITNNYTGETTNYEKVESAMFRALNKANKKPITLNNRELRRGLRDGGIVLA